MKRILSTSWSSLKLNDIRGVREAGRDEDSGCVISLFQIRKYNWTCPGVLWPVCVAMTCILTEVTRAASSVLFGREPQGRAVEKGTVGKVWWKALLTTYGRVQCEFWLDSGVYESAEPTLTA